MVLNGLQAVSHFCVLAWIEADPSLDQQHWGGLKLVWGVHSCVPTVPTSLEQCHTLSS